MATKKTEAQQVELVQEATQGESAPELQPDAERETAESQPELKREMVKARVLVDGIYGSVNDVVEVPADLVSGELDTHPDAVAYAESLSNGAAG